MILEKVCENKLDSLIQFTYPLLFSNLLIRGILHLIDTICPSYLSISKNNYLLSFLFYAFIIFSNGTNANCVIGLFTICTDFPITLMALTCPTS